MNQSDKKKIIEGFATLTASHALALFNGLKLQTGFSATVEDMETGKTYCIQFHEIGRSREHQAIVNKLSAMSQSDLDEIYCFISQKNSLPPY